MKLNDLVPNEGSKKPKKRVGRGISAGQGKTAGRGTKGQGSRTGKPVRLYLQGGNLPFFRRLPFMRGKGFTPLSRVNYARSIWNNSPSCPLDLKLVPKPFPKPASSVKPASPWSSWAAAK